MRKFCISICVFVTFSFSQAFAINTFKQWDGSQAMFGFGCAPGDGTTFGQVITVPERMTHLTRFTFWWSNEICRGPMTVRGEVYAWAGHKVIGSSMYESEPRTIAFDDDAFHKESFSPAGLAVTPDEKYVVFASIDKDYEQCLHSYSLGWGWTSIPKVIPCLKKIAETSSAGRPRNG